MFLCAHTSARCSRHLQERITVLESENKRLKTRLAANAGDNDLVTFLWSSSSEGPSYVEDLKRRLSCVHFVPNSSLYTYADRPFHCQRNRGTGILAGEDLGFTRRRAAGRRQGISE